MTVPHFLDTSGLSYLWNAILGKANPLNAYPVGSIYMSVNSTSPATLFGGTWERIQDAFLLAAGSSYSAGSTGGAATVTLTAAQSGVPAHAHGLNSHTHSVGAHAHGLNSHKHTYDKANTPSGSTTLTTDQIPSHTHPPTKDKFITAVTGSYVPTQSSGWGIPNWTLRDATGATGGGKGHTHTIGYTSTSSGAASGSTANSTAFDSGAASGNTANNATANASEAHDNMPPYLTVYVWKRTA